MFLFHTIGALAVLLLISGCGSKQPATARVTGTVMYNGAPLQGAQVTFFGAQGRPASGVADQQGRFRLMTFQPEDGALPGEYQVVITKTEPVSTDSKNPYAPMRNLIPERYGQRAKSGLSATVQLGKTNEFTFELTD